LFCLTFQTIQQQQDNSCFDEQDHFKPVFQLGFRSGC